MTPLERLLAEELPTGTFGGPRPAQPRRETTALEAASNRGRLETALNQRDSHGTRQPDRHLRAIPPAA